MVSCPSHSELEHFLDGRVSADEEERIQAHQTTCADCRDWIADARADEALLPDLRRAREGSASAGTLPTPTGLDDAEPDMARYRILGRLGAGGMGVVYEAEQRSPKRKVALKVLRAGLFSPRALRRFDHEAEALGRLVHPGIAQILEAGTYESHGEQRPFFAMELVEGQPLGKWAGESVHGVRARLELFLEICAAVEHAHQKGVVHRDLKPANVIVTAEGHTKVLDFGVARTFDADVQVSTLRSEAGEIVGTLPYMSPEQLSGDPLEIDTRSDVYALGVLLYELLSGQLPYRTTSRSVPEMIRLMGVEDPEPLSLVRPDLPDDLGTITGKALEKDKAQRYSSAAALADDVRRHLNYEPIEARPPSAVYHLRKFARRNRAVVAGLALTFAVLLAGLATTSWQAARARRAELDAVESEQLARAAEAKAVAETAAVKEVNFFLHSMIGFDPMDPLGARYRGDTTLMEIVANAEQMLDEHPLTDRSSESKIRIAIAAIWSRLEDEQRCLKNRERALELRLEMGPRHLKVAEARNTVAVSLVSLGDLGGAEEQLREALSIYEELADPEQDRKMATTLGNLGAVLRRQGDMEGAVELLERALEIHRRTLGPYNLHVSGGVYELAELSYDRGDVDGAIERVREAIEIARTAGLIQHPHAVASLSKLAGWLVLEGRRLEAEPVFRESVEIHERLYAEDHIELARERLHLATLLKGMGQFEEAIEILDKVIPALRHHPDQVRDMGYALLVMGECHEDDPERALFYLREAMAKLRVSQGGTPSSLAAGRVSIGSALYRSGDVAGAERAYRQALQDSSGEETSPTYVATASFTLASIVLEGGGSVEEAERLLRQVIEIEPAVRRRVGDHLDSTLVSARIALAGLLRSRGDLAEAEELLWGALAPELDPGEWIVHSARRELARLLTDRGDHDAAETFLTEVLDGMDATSSDERSRRAELLARLGTAKAGLGLADACEQLYAEALAEVRAVHGENSEDTAELLSGFGEALMLLGQNERAARTFEDSLDITGDEPPADAHAAEHLADYGRCLIALERHGDAEAILLDCLAGVELFAADGDRVTRDVLRLLAELYEAWEMPDSASEYRERLASIAGSGE